MLSPSSLQKASATPPSGNDVRATGWPLPSAYATYKFLMSARSQINATRLPSGDQKGSDGCLMSINCSMVSRDAFWHCAEVTQTHAAPTRLNTILSLCFHPNIDPPAEKGGCILHPPSGPRCEKPGFARTQPSTQFER